MTPAPARLAIAGLVSAAALLACAAGSVQAQDSRLVTRVYDDAEVVTIEGKLGVQATIGFGEGEQIENVAVGDADKWQITPNKRADLLFVKPLDAAARTNMTVVTDKHTYFFDLVASPAAKPIYMLRFTYGPAKTAIPVAEAPIPVAAEAPPAAALATPGILQPAGKVIATRSGESAPIADAGAAAPGPPPASTAMPQDEAVGGSVDPALLNFSWRRKGVERIGPARIYDDGTSTYLLWAQGQELPVILVRDETGEERPAEFAIRGNTTVLPMVPREILLRGSRASLLLENLREAEPAPADAPPAATEAASPETGGAQAN